MKNERKVAKITFIVLLIILIFIIVTCVITFEVVTFGVNLDKNALEYKSTTSVIYDANGKPISYSEQKNYVEYEDLPQCLIDAFVSIEDKKFFSHHGIDIGRTLGAAAADVKVGYFKEGGSTISQQLIKNTMLSGEKTFTRKMKELKLAILLEKEYSKEEILTIYLNKIYYGSGFYGIAEASYGYFNKDTINLTLPEACILAGVVKNPRDYSPLNNSEKAEERMKVVLDSMKKDGKITESDYLSAIRYKFCSVVDEENTNDLYADYLQETLKEATEILNIDETKFMKSGYKVITYCNMEQYKNLIGKLKTESYAVNNADISILKADNVDGGITAYYSTHNESLHSLKRSPGSTLKPFVAYAPAIEYGYYYPCSPVLDENRSFSGYSPANFGNKYLGWCTFREAVSTSSNAVATALMYEMGVDFCLDFATERFNLQFNENDGLAAALGGLTDGTTLSDMCEAYMTIASGGINKEIRFINKIYDIDGKLVYENTPKEKRTISRETAYILTDMLLDVAHIGTGKGLGKVSANIACKTGTNGTKNGNLDAYNVSYTTDSTLLVWYGALDGKNPMDSTIGGGGYPTMLAKSIYKCSKNEKYNEFTPPAGIVKLKIDTFATNLCHTVYLSGTNTPEMFKKQEIFARKNVPNKYYSYWDALPYDRLNVAN